MLLAASSSSAAASSSPSRWHASPTRRRVRAISYGASQRVPGVTRTAQRGECRLRVAFREVDRALCVAANAVSIALSRLRASSCSSRDARRAFSVSPTASMISTKAGRRRARSVGGEVAASARRIAAAAASARPCARRSWASPGCGSQPNPLASLYASSAAENSPCRRRSSPWRYRARPAAGFSVATNRSPARRASRNASDQEPSSCSISARCTRQRPVNAIISGCSAHQSASALVHSRARLHLVHLLAREDDAAVDDPGDDRRELLGGDRDHRLVEQGQALPCAPVLDQHVALSVDREREEVPVAEPLADAKRLACCGRCRGEVAGRLMLEHHWQQQVAALGALILVLEEPLRAAQPARSRADLATGGKVQPEPQRAPNSTQRLPALEVSLMRTLQPRGRLVVPTEHEGAGREKLGVGCFQRRPLLRCGKRLIRLGPSPLRISLTAPLERGLSLHRVILHHAAVQRAPVQN